MTHFRVVRPCGGCTVCCDVLPIPEIGRDWDDGCHFCVSGVGCSVYPHRARLLHPICVTYTCAWTLGAGTDEDRPDRSGVLVDRRSGKDGKLRWYALTCRGNANPDTLDRVCDSLGECIYHAYRDGKVFEEWQPSQ